MSEEYNWEPVGFRVLVKADVVEDKTESGIYIPQQVVEQEQAGISTGVVVALGPIAFDDDGGPRFWCQVGDRVKWPRYAGRADISEDGTIYHILNDKDILLRET